MRGQALHGGFSLITREADETTDEKPLFMNSRIVIVAIGCLETHNALWRHYSWWRQGGHQPNSIDL